MNFREAMKHYGNGGDVQFKNSPLGDWEVWNPTWLDNLEWDKAVVPKYQVLFEYQGKHYLSELLYTSAQAFINAWADDGYNFIKLVEETRQ